jgi:hypothetical protein
MTKIDRVFCTTSWEGPFLIAHQSNAWVSTISDHCPLILQGDTTVGEFKGFRFEA